MPDIDFKLVSVVIALTQFFKTFGISGKWNVLVAMLSSIFLVVVPQLFPEQADLVFEALTTGLVACGAYRLVKDGGSAILQLGGKDGNQGIS